MTDEKPKLTKAQEVFIDEYLTCFNATEAYSRAYPKAKRTSCAVNGHELLRNTNIKAEIDRRLDEVHMSADEALKAQADIARAGLGIFFRITDEWTFYPLPTSEILDQREVVDDTNPEKPVKRISYRERRVILDMDKILDPQYSRLIKKFSDTKNGLSIELYPADAAQERILKVAGKFTDRVDVTSGGEKIELIVKYADTNSKPTETPQ